MRSKAVKAATQKRYRARKMLDPVWAAQKRAADKQHWLANRERGQFNTARHQAKKRGLKFSVKFDDIVWPEFCPVFGERLRREPKGPNDWSPSLDRIDSTKGYEPGNVIVVSMRANRIKSDATVAELDRVAAFYRNL